MKAFLAVVIVLIGVGLASLAILAAIWAVYPILRADHAECEFPIKTYFGVVSRHEVSWKVSNKSSFRGGPFHLNEVRYSIQQVNYSNQAQSYFGMLSEAAVAPPSQAVRYVDHTAPPTEINVEDEIVLRYSGGNYVLHLHGKNGMEVGNSCAGVEVNATL